MVDYYTAADCEICVGSTTMPIWSSNATTTGTNASEIWRVWTNATTTSATGTLDYIQLVQQQVWTQWNRSHLSIIEDIREGARLAMGPYLQGRMPARRAQMSAEELALHQQYERDTERKYEEEKAARIAAEAKAELLLQRLLNLEQREQLKERGHFYLHSAGKRYRIDRGQTGNVKLVDEKNEVVESYCIHPNGVPDADAMAAQKLMLETDPETFRRVANITFRNGAIRHGTPMRAVG